MSYNDLFQIDATLVANEFLDKYMPSANGDYVKVYLYLLRNRINGVDVETIAEQLALTEGDVRRAIKYWEKCGILSIGSGKRASSEDDAAPDGTNGAAEAPAGRTETPSAEDAGKDAGTAGAGKAETAAEHPEEEPAAAVKDESGEIRKRYRRADGRDALNRLSEDEEFRQLLFIVQKYRSKILTESEEQVLAYLYDGLHLPCEVLDYLVQYCVENNHDNMRYIEKTGLDWATIGVRTVKDAKRRTKEFDKAKESSARKKTAKNDKAGITRGKDLDEWLKNQVVKRNIQ